jgi:hypothetical protein
MVLARILREASRAISLGDTLHLKVAMARLAVYAIYTLL